MEEVEDVKTFLRMLPLFIATIGFTSALFLWQPQGKLMSKYSVHCIIFEYHCAYHITVLLLFFIYQFIIRSCFHQYIPSMLTRIGAGLVFALLGCVTQLLVHIFASYDFLLIIRQILFRIYMFFIYPTSLEFTVAQSPEYMRGLMVNWTVLFF